MLVRLNNFNVTRAAIGLPNPTPSTAMVRNSWTILSRLDLQL